jgi:hypothetical protein
MVVSSLYLLISTKETGYGDGENPWVYGAGMVRYGNTSGSTQSLSPFLFE